MGLLQLMTWVVVFTNDDVTKKFFFFLSLIFIGEPRCFVVVGLVKRGRLRIKNEKIIRKKNGFLSKLPRFLGLSFYGDLYSSICNMHVMYYFAFNNSACTSFWIVGSTSGTDVINNTYTMITWINPWIETAFQIAKIALLRSLNTIGMVIWELRE